MKKQENRTKFVFLAGLSLCLLLTCGCTEKIPEPNGLPQSEPPAVSGQATAADSVLPTQPGPSEEVTVPTQPDPTQAPTEPATEPPTEPATEPATRPEKDPQPDPTQAPTEPATEPATEPEETQPVTEPIPQIDSQSVIRQVLSGIAAQLPQLKQADSIRNGVEAVLQVELDKTEAQMAASLLTDIHSIIREAQSLNGEDQNYRFRLIYLGGNAQGTRHQFCFNYQVDVPVVEIPKLEPSEVVSQVTRALENSSQIEVTRFDGSGYTECVTYRQVPLFYTTQEAAQCLIQAAESEIKIANIFETVYTQFRFVFSAEEEDCYVFLLYLK